MGPSTGRTSRRWPSIPNNARRGPTPIGFVSDRVAELAQYRGVDEAAIIQRAVATGVETLYRDRVVSRSLDGTIAREEAVEELGPDVVADVIAAGDAVDEDVERGLHA